MAKGEQVLNVDALKKGSRMNISSVFARVGDVLLDEAGSDTAKIVFGDVNNIPLSVFIAVKGKDNVLKVVKFMETMENETR